MKNLKWIHVLVKLLFIVAKYADETIKVLQPIQDDRKALFQNEIYILNNLNQKFQNKINLSVDNGIVRLLANGKTDWKHEVIAKKSIVQCLAIVYTFGVPLFH